MRLYDRNRAIARGAKLASVFISFIALWLLGESLKPAANPIAPAQEAQQP